ncbi:uncharacterized protein LOC144709058 [Wolffia australiana]
MEPPKYEELLRQVRELLEKGLIQESLSPCALYAHPKKCSFLTSKVAFLGFIVSAQGIAADPEKALKYLHSQQKLSERRARRGNVLNVMKMMVLGFETIRDGYDSCPDFSPIIAEATRGLSPDYKDYVLTDGYLFFKNRLCVPRTSLHDFLTWECHAGGRSGHFGRDKTITAVECQFYWPSLKRDVGNIVA